MKPIVSVIITTFNRPQYLAEAIESILTQDFKDLELIVVNDASTDEKTEQIILSCKDRDQRIKYIKNERNLNSVRSLNAGLKSASGKYIAILDDDDVWICKEKLLQQVKFLEENNEYVLAGTNIIAVNSETGREIARSKYALTDEKIRKTILGNNPFAHSSVVYRKDAVLSLGGYDENLKRGKDYDLWLRLGKLGKMAVLPEFWVKYRINTSSRKNAIKVKRNDSRVKLTIMKKHSSNYPNFLFPYIVEWIRYLIFSAIA